MASTVAVTSPRGPLFPKPEEKIRVSKPGQARRSQKPIGKEPLQTASDATTNGGGSGGSSKRKQTKSRNGACVCV